MNDMARRFNTTGPCYPAEHYMLKPEDRCPGVMKLIEEKHFFVIHAPRQSGKTTLLKTVTRQLNAGNRYHALYCSLETAQGMNELERGIPTILSCIQAALPYNPGLKELAILPIPSSNLATSLAFYLRELSAKASRPLVVFFDEADCLGGETLISFLRQLRDGYINRGDIPFVHSLALVGMRNIRDYRMQVRPDSLTLGSASPFNISKAALTLSGFSAEEISQLYRQHTEATGQVFPPELIHQVSEMTRGQPWLVNAIAAEIIEEICKRNFALPLSRQMSEDAIQRIILRRDTHIDSLLERLKEKRVQRVIEPMLLGEGYQIEELSDDYQYVSDLGLIRNESGVIRPANPIYAEVIARTLNYNVQQRLPVELIRKWMSKTDIAMSDLLRAFQEFWRDNSEMWCDRFEYKEAAPHLILLAFLQRVVNGGARIHREFATGTRRIDICIDYADKRYPIEMKILYKDKTRTEGIEQLSAYMNTMGCNEGWLVLCNRDNTTPWEQKLTWETIVQGGRQLHLVGV